VFVLDIYRVRFRYLSYSSQISINYKLDITKNSNLYYLTLSELYAYLEHNLPFPTFSQSSQES